MNIKRYGLVYVAIALGLMLLALAADLLFGFDIANGGMTLIPPMGAAMIEGQKFVQAEDRQPESGEMWRFARLAGLVALAIAMVASVALSFVVPQLRALMSMQFGAGILMGAALLQGGLAFLVTRYFLGMGAKSQAKAKKSTKS